MSGLLALLLTLALALPGSAAADSEPRQLLARSLSAAPTLFLSDDDRQWLNQRKVLHLGSSSPDYPPFDINVSPTDYEGLSADYAGLIGEQLDIPVQVLRYPHREAAIAALHRGEIDLLGSSNGFEAADATLALSQPYADDLPVIAIRQGRSLKDNHALVGLRLAMVDHYLPVATVRALYPQAHLALYRSTQAGLSAVALGEADAYIGDAISTDFSIGRAWQGLVRIDHFVPTEPGVFAFAFTRQDPRLRRMVDRALARISDSERMNILRRWSSGNTSLLLQRQLSGLTADEQAWLARTPAVRVLVNPSLAPLTFNDSRLQPAGITLDVLKQITLRTGLHFEVQERDSVLAMIDEVASGNAQMIGALDYGPEREARLRYTRPYLVSPAVQVVRQTAAPLTSLEGQRVALIRTASQHVAVLQANPGVRIVEADNALALMETVANGKADVAVVSHIAAAYYLTHVFKDKLRIAGLQGDTQIAAAFAVAPDLPQLQSILNKALLSIPPEELDQLINRWRVSTVVSDSLWANYRTLVLQILGVGIVLLTAAVLWNRYLRRLIRERGEAQRALQAQLTLSQSLLEQLRQAKDAAERASQAKSSFLAIMSHEIRTPMNAVIGLLEMALEDARQGHSDPQALGTAHDSALGLLELIGDILDISRIESGHMTLQPLPTDLRELVSSVVRTFEASAQIKGLSLLTELPEAPLWVTVDPVRLRQVLSNLLSNAIKFTTQGQVDVRLSARALASGQLHKVELRVRDSGQGISAADQTRLFQSFAQLDGQRARQGAGLGLIISRTLCQLMQGDLQLHSQQDVGTQVVIDLTLPCAQPTSPTVALLPDAQAESTPLDILVVDDYPANLLLLDKQLRSFGHRVTQAANGEEALALWQAQAFDVLITDCSMPVMDGFELTRRIRALEQLRSTSPCRIIGVTANAQVQARTQCLEAGMDDCLFKPIGLQALKVLLPQARVEPPPAPDSGFDLAQLRHLTQDDASLTRRLLEQLAQSTAEDRQALTQLGPQAPAERISAVVHRIKGGARMLKCRGLVRDCDALEQALAEGAPSEATFQRLQANLHGLERQLREGLTAIAGSS